MSIIKCTLDFVQILVISTISHSIANAVNNGLHSKTLASTAYRIYMLGTARDTTHSP